VSRDGRLRAGVGCELSRGFKFLGCGFRQRGLSVLPRQTVERCVERMNQLYEQGAGAVRIGDYVRRWR
jgi:hypothetical protein